MSDKEESNDKELSNQDEDFKEDSDFGSESDGESSDDEEEEEPKLKYERVRGDLTTLLDRDSLNSISSNDKMIVLGTMGGGVIILDHLGYKIQHRRPHVAPVIDVHLSNDYWASAGKDRKVVVNGILSQEYKHQVNFESGSVTCVLLDPSFGVSRPKTRFIVGHTQGMHLYEKGIFSGYRATVISDLAGGSIGSSLGLTGISVRGAAWCGDLLSWASDVSVRVYDLTLKTTIALVQRDHSAALDCIQFPPRLHWSSDDLLLIGWADSVKICRVKQRPRADRQSHSQSTSPSGSSRRNSSASVAATGGQNSEARRKDFSKQRQNPSQSSFDASSQSIIFNSSIVGVTGGYSPRSTPPPMDLPPRFLEIEKMFTTDFYICGLAMLEDNVLLALTYNKTPSLENNRSSPTDTKGPQQFTNDLFEWRRPQLRLLQPNQRDYEEVSKDILGTHKFKDYLPLHYKLERVTSGDRWYVLSPRDLVAVKPRESSDSMQWLMEHHKYALALQLVSKEGGKIGEYTEESVGKEYLTYLLEYKMFMEAAEIATKVVGDDVGRWKDLVKIYSDANCLGSLYDSLPYTSSCHLSVDLYDLVLTNLLENDRAALVKAVQKWPSWCYSVNTLVGLVLKRVAAENWSTHLLQTLAHLYSHQQNHEKALAIYLKLEHKDIFGLIKKHLLYSSISIYAVQLMNLDDEITVDMCMKNASHICVSDMIEALKGHPLYTYKYLNALYEHHQDLCKGHHDLLLQMMADNKQDDQLMEFLKSSTDYDLSQALRICKERGLLYHTVYLLERTGNTQDALSLVLLEAEDLTWAINLCKDHNDAHLWATLIDNTIDYAANICPLLEGAGKFVGEARIIQRIPHGLKVEYLVETLQKIVDNIRKKFSLHSGCEKLCKKDLVCLMKRRRNHARRAVVVDYGTGCESCARRIVCLQPDSVISFKCGHVYHRKCITDSSYPACAVCQLKNNWFR